MGFLLNAIYLATLIAAAPWMVWRAIRTGRYREGWPAKLLGLVPDRREEQPCIWVHAVSVGEVQLLRPFLASLQSAYPNEEIVISTTTQTGMQLAQKLFPNNILFYCPMDFTWSVRRCIQRIRPKLLVLAELELWPNLVTEAKAAKCQVAVVNGRLSERSFRGYGQIGWLTSKTLKQIDWVGVQDETYATRFVALGADPKKVEVTGSMKFDGAEFDRAHEEVLTRSRWLGLDARHRIWVVGSTQSPEEQIALDAFQQLTERFPDLRLIIVPRHPERFPDVAKQIEHSGLRWIRRSQVGNFANAEQWQVLLADSVGELRWWWGLAHLGFVGGSFGNRGGQNMIEPAAYGVCTSFGPNTKNFQDIVRLLLDADSAKVLENPKDLLPWMIEMLENPEVANGFGQRARQVAFAHRGATHRTIDGLSRLLESPTIQVRMAA